jgi:magnesium transporter
VEASVITIYKNSETGLARLEEPVNGCWIRVEDPSPKEIASLVEAGIPQDFITPALDLDERSRTEREDNGDILIVLRVPVDNGKKADIPFTTVPVGMILTDKYMVTVSKRPSELFEDFASGKMKGFSTAKRNRFVLRLLHNAANQFLVNLKEINNTVDALEDQLQRSMRNKEVLDLLRYQKSLVYFTTSLKANELVLERLQRSQLFKMYPDDEDLLDDAIIENQQALEMVNVSGSILNSMVEAFSSIISNNLNVVMKFLTSVTIVLSIPSIVVSLSGLNMGVLFHDRPLDALLGGIMYLLVAAVVIWLFMRKDWF